MSTMKYPFFHSLLSIEIPVIFYLLNFSLSTSHTLYLAFPSYSPTTTTMNPTIKPEDPDSNNPTLTPSTPQKRTKAQQPLEDPESPTKKSKTKSPAKKGGPLGPIPTSYDEAGEADKVMLRMRGTENKPWAEIKDVLEGITGASLVAGSIQVRYARIKANLVVFEKEDVSFELWYGVVWCIRLMVAE